MRVSRLEIFGFKSFVERFVLNFDKNFIGIVGPNGCGKSNVVDALRWVLGETHSKQLRGGCFEDLIFTGSQNRRPLGMAEVSLVISTDSTWATMLKSASVKPAESNQTEETISPTDCDTPEKQGSGINTEASVEEVTSEDSTEVQESEEQDTSHPIISSSILDIPGVLDAAEIQISRRLYRSGESEYFINRVACRLRDIVDLLRLIGLGARGLSIVQQGQIGEFISRKPIERRELLEEAAGISGFRTRLESAQKKLFRNSENMLRLNDIVIEVEKQTKVLKRQANRARNRAELKSELKQAEESLYRFRCACIMQRTEQAKEKRQMLAERISEIKASVSVADASCLELASCLSELDVQIAEKRAKRDELGQVLASQREQLQSAELALVRHEAKEKARDGDIQRLKERRDNLEKEQEERKEKLEKLSDDVSVLEKKKSEKELLLAEIVQANSKVHTGNKGEIIVTESEQIKEFRRQITQLRSELSIFDTVQKEIEGFESKIREIRHAIEKDEQALKNEQLSIARVEAEINSLNMQMQSLAKKVVAAAEKGKEETQKLEINRENKLKILASAIHVPREFERAVLAILGEKGQYLLSDEPNSIAVNYENNVSDKTVKLQNRFGIIDTNKDCSCSNLAIASGELNSAPSARLLSEVIAIDSEYEHCCCSFFRDVVLVNTLSEAIALNNFNQEQGKKLRTVVTLSGEVVTAWGWYTTYGETVSVSYRRRIDELESSLIEKRKNLTIVLSDLEKKRVSLGTLLTELNEKTTFRKDLLLKQQNLSALLDMERQEERRLRDEAIRQERIERESAIQKERQAQAELRQSLSEIAQLNSSVSYEQRRINSIEEEIIQINKQSAELEESCIKLLEERKQLTLVLEQIGSAVNAASRSEIETQINSIQASIKEIDVQRAGLVAEVSAANQNLSELKSKLNSFHEQDRVAVLDIEKCDFELNMLTQDILRFYTESFEKPDFEQAKVLFASVQDSDSYQKSLEENASSLRRKLDREGEVDPQSIELYEAEAVRLENMKSQYADLQAASATLDRTIKQLKEISKTRFLNTFNDVREKFTVLIPRLFGGGAGNLELINPEDPLGSGIEIVVRMPGKKVTSMDLLSGGEKALVATAVLISTFLHRASPICVLDEVDAPLDDVNLDRFVGIMKEISSITQCLIITHNKTTMSSVDRLIGITMEEPGVSKAVSVTLEDAEKTLLPMAVNE